MVVPYFIHYSFHKLTCNLMMIGTSSLKVVIDIKQCYVKHKDIAEDLLGIHAISGCDTTACLFGIGKLTALIILKSGVTVPSIASVILMQTWAM